MASGHGVAEGAGVCAGNEEADVRPSGRGKITVPWFAVLFLVAIGINSMLQSMPFIPSDILNGKLGVYVCHHGFSLGGNPVYNNSLSGYGEGFDF